MKVELKSIPNYPDYEITEDGHVWSIRRGIWLQPGNVVGYKCYNLCAKGQYARQYTAGRLVLETYIGPCPLGKECCHRNDIKQDDRLENLYWGTSSENCADAVRNNRRGKVLNIRQVRVIHHLLKSGELTQKEIGRVFGLKKSSTIVSKIACGHIWSTITGRIKRC